MNANQAAAGRRHPVWDLPTRLCHWLLAAAFPLSWLSHEQGWQQVHLWSGYTVLTLAAFRLAWGFVGSRHSRFADFARGPGAVLRYFRTVRGRAPRRPGHNPAGGWAALAMLALLLAQGLTGLFNSDGLLFDGPLHHALDDAWTDRLGAWHEYLFWGLCVMVALHLTAIALYRLALRRDLIGPMLHGGGGGAAAPVSSLRAALVLAACAGLLALAVLCAPEPVLPW